MRHSTLRWALVMRAEIELFWVSRSNLVSIFFFNVCNSFIISLVLFPFSFHCLLLSADSSIGRHPLGPLLICTFHGEKQLPFSSGFSLESPNGIKKSLALKAAYPYLSLSGGPARTQRVKLGSSDLLQNCAIIGMKRLFFQWYCKAHKASEILTQGRICAHICK